jgi:threonine dehydratase
LNVLPLKSDLEEAYTRVFPYVYRTPILTSSLLNEMTSAKLFFKCENFQRMGAFKMRGAIHAILKLSDEQKQAGVITHSSGNFGQAISLAARTLGITAYVVMPQNAPQVKKEAVASYGGIITECESTLEAREAIAARIGMEKGATFLHPSNNTDVILGNATVAIELLQEKPELDIIICPVGGGGLLAGTALAVHYFGNGCKAIAGEPAAADDAYRSLQSGKIETNDRALTIADGLRTHLGNKNFPIIKKHVSEIIRVEESEIIESLKGIWERMKIVVEPSSAVSFAAILKQPQTFKNKRVGVILSGGNVDLSNLPF